MFERDNLKKIATNDKTSDNWLKYKLTRNNVNDRFKCAKVGYYNNYFKETLGNTMGFLEKGEHDYEEKSLLHRDR